MFQHFEWLPFLIGVAVGILGIFFFRTEKPILVRYPHPENVEKIIYRDPNSQCYKYVMEEVNCDKHESTLKPYPIQDSLPLA